MIPAALLLLAVCASAAEPGKKPWRPPKLRKGFSAADLPSGSTTTARAVGQSPALSKPRALSKTPLPDLEPGQIKVPLTPYEWGPDAKIQKVEAAPAPKPPAEAPKEVAVTIPEMKVYEEPPQKPLEFAQPAKALPPAEPIKTP